MSRPISLETKAETGEERRTGRSTARAFAAAISALLMSTLVVNRSSEALTTDGTVTGNQITSGVIALSDDDQGRSLFDLSDMAPGQTEVHCLEVSYDGTITPVDLTMITNAEGPLAAYLDVVIEAGTGGNFEDCEGFEKTSDVFDGTLDELARGRESCGRADLERGRYADVPIPVLAGRRAGRPGQDGRC